VAAPTAAQIAGRTTESARISVRTSSCSRRNSSSNSSAIATAHFTLLICHRIHYGVRSIYCALAIRHLDQMVSCRSPVLRYRRRTEGESKGDKASGVSRLWLLRRGASSKNQWLREVSDTFTVLPLGRIHSKLFRFVAMGVRQRLAKNNWDGAGAKRLRDHGTCRDPKI
jgi:hypothetical protein